MIQIKRRGARIIIREHLDRNGPALSVPFADKATFRAAINGLVNDGDEVTHSGRFRVETDTTRQPVAIFKDEADADIFLTGKPARFNKRNQGEAVDGFSWVITED